MQVTTDHPLRRGAARRREATVTRRLELVAEAVAGLAGRLGTGGLARLPERHTRPSGRRRP